MELKQQQEYYNKIYSLLTTIKNENNLDNEHDALIFWYGNWFIGIDKEDIKERTINDKNGEGIDAILLDEVNTTFYFIQAETVKNVDKIGNEFSEDKVKGTFTGLRLLIKGDYKRHITPDIEDLVDEFHEKNKYNGYKIVMLFLLMKKAPTRSTFIDQFKEEFPDIELKFFDFEKLINCYQEYLTKTASAPDRIKFTISSESSRKILDKKTPINARVFTVKAEEVATNYDMYKDSLFQENLRYNLETEDSAINEGIYKTSIDPITSQNFWYFNNGITIVCKKIEEPVNQKDIYLRRAQIINGAQTTYAIHKAFNEGKLSSDALILIKVIETEDKDLREQIARYSNSQNAINLRDLASNDDVQTKIQRELLNKGYFYERKRGEFDALYPTEEAKINVLGRDYTNKIIENTKAAQAFLAYFLDQPSAAKAQKSNIFNKTEGGFYKQVFDIGDASLSNKLLISWGLLRYIEKRKREYKKRYKLTENLQDAAQKEEVYSQDFILHADYFILNLFKYKILKYFEDSEYLLKIITLVESNDTKITDIYNEIIQGMTPLFKELKKTPDYYPTKFFKAEGSLGIVIKSIEI